MSIEIMNLVWKNAPYESNTLLTMLALADWSSDAGESWPSLEVLATKSRQSERNTRYCLRKMEKDGYLSTSKRKDTSSVYRLNVEKLRGAKIAGGGGQNGAQGGQTTTENVSQIAPYTSLNRHIEPSTPSAPASQDAVATAKPDSKPKSTPKPKPEVDPRVAACIDVWTRAFRHYNPDAASAPWGGAEGAKLKAFLKLYPKFTDHDFALACKNYFASEGVDAPMPAFKRLLPNLAVLRFSPIDRYNKAINSLPRPNAPKEKTIMERYEEQLKPRD